MNRLGTASLFIAYGLVSILMTFLNKNLVRTFPLLLTTLFLQNSGAVLASLFLYGFNFQRMEKIKISHFLPALFNAVWLLAVIFTSMKALQHVSVPLYALASNARPLSTAVVEFVWSGVRLSFVRVLSLFCIVAGAALFAFNDSSVSNKGLAYAVWYTVLVAGLSVYENSMMKSMKTEQTPFGVNLYRLVLCTALIAVLMVQTEDYSLVFEIEKSTQIVLLSSSGLCLMIGIVMFHLQNRATATSIQVANVCFKLMGTVASIIIHPEQATAVTLQGWVGYLISTIGFISYSFAPQFTPSKKSV